jgi:hypothetical protein
VAPARSRNGRGERSRHLTLVRSPNTIGTQTQVVENSLSEVVAFVEAISRFPWRHQIRALGNGLAGLRRKPYAGAALQEGIGPIPMGLHATLSSVMPWSFTA